MAILHLTCGKIACGKTYFAKNLCKDNKTVHLSVDEMMLTLYNECLGESHHEIELKCLKILLSIAVRIIKCGTDCVIDHGFWNSEDRLFASKYCEDNGIQFKWHFFDIDDSIRKERLNNRNKELLHSKKREYIINDEMLERFDSWFDAP